MINVLLISILAFALASGQLIRIPINSQGINILDITVSLFCFWGILKAKINLGKPPPQIMAALVFIAVAVISLIFTPLHLNFDQYLLSFSYIVRLFLYVLFAWLIASSVFGDFKKSLVRILLLSGIAFALLGLLQFIFFPNLDFLITLGWDPHYFRTVSTFLDPNFAGGFLVLTLILLTQNFSKNKRWGIFFFVIIYLALLTTFSRSSYLMFLVSGLTVSLMKRSKIYTLITFILFFLLLVGFQIYTQAVAKPRQIDRDQSASSRLSSWQQGFSLFQKSPILGIGFNAYRYGLKEYKIADEQFLESHGSSSNDSSLLYIASTTGIIGFMVYLYFLFSLAKHSLKAGNQLLLPALLGLLLHSIFANSLFYPPILTWILLISINPKK